MPRIPRDHPMHAAYYGGTLGCHSHEDGDCYWKGCPQLRDKEPEKTGRNCPLDNSHELEL